MSTMTNRVTPWTPGDRIDSKWNGCRRGSPRFSSNQTGEILQSVLEHAGAPRLSCQTPFFLQILSGGRVIENSHEKSQDFICYRRLDRPRNSFLSSASGEGRTARGQRGTGAAT